MGFSLPQHRLAHGVPLLSDLGHFWVNKNGAALITAAAMEKNAIGGLTRRKTQNSADATTQSNNGRHSTYTLVRRAAEKWGGGREAEREGANERREIRYSNPSANGQS